MERGFLLVLVVAGMITGCYGQSSFGVSVGLAGNGVVQPAIVDGGYYDFNTGLVVGFQYQYQFKSRLHLVTGIASMKNTFYAWGDVPPTVDYIASQVDIHVVCLPFLLRADLSKHLYANGGAIFGFDVTGEKNLSSQTGLGAGAGVGLEFPLGKRLLLQLEPFVNLYGILQFKREDGAEKLLAGGFKTALLLNRPGRLHRK